MTPNQPKPYFAGKLCQDGVPQKQPKNMQYGPFQGQISQVNWIKRGAPKAIEHIQNKTLQGHILYKNCINKGAPKAAEHIQHLTIQGQILQVNCIKKGDQKQPKTYEAEDMQNGSV